MTAGTIQNDIRNTNTQMSIGDKSVPRAPEPLSILFSSVSRDSKKVHLFSKSNIILIKTTTCFGLYTTIIEEKHMSLRGQLCEFSSTPSVKKIQNV